MNLIRFILFLIKWVVSIWKKNTYIFLNVWRQFLRPAFKIGWEPMSCFPSAKHILQV